jgi:DNA-binding GntR family transcriptional regulator
MGDLPAIESMSLDSYLSEFPRQTPTAAESVTRVLRQAILDGVLSGGSMLRQEELARKFGVSRVPIREALLKLEGEGLVETQPRRGVVVTALSAEDFEEILEMRVALESLALRWAAPRFRPEDAAAVREILARAEAGLHAAGGANLLHEFESRWGDLNWEFHRRLYLPGNRPRLMATLENLHQLFARHLRVRIATAGGASEAGEASSIGEPSPASQQEALAANRRQEWATVLDEHRLMLEACERHDARAACAVLKHHISDHGAELVHRLREHTVDASTPTV